jgi:septal ring factor EnvC (AmiA/AmiB activator)
MTKDLLKKFKKANRLAKYKLKMAFARIESETNKKFNQQIKQCDKRLAKLKQEKKSREEDLDK